MGLLLPNVRYRSGYGQGGLSAIQVCFTGRSQGGRFVFYDLGCLDFAGFWPLDRVSIKQDRIMPVLDSGINSRKLLNPLH